MQRKTVIAIKQSITKWKCIRHHNATNHGSDDCALCERFPYDQKRNRPCTRSSPVTKKIVEHCPVSIATGKTSCENTPYEQFINTATNGLANTAISKRHATRMIKFLEKLLADSKEA